MYLTTLQTYELAEKSLLENPNLKRAIIVKQTPRYDDSVKMYLSDYANQVLDDIWKSKGCPNKIVISSLDLHCDGELRYQRYGDMNQGNYDGVHLRGPLAGQHMTMKFIKMITDIYPHLRPQSLKAGIPALNC